MPKYRLNKDHYLQDNARGIAPRLHPKGSTVDWDGPPSLAMSPIDKEATERKTAYDANRPKRGQASAQVGYSAAFERNFTKLQTMEHDEAQPPIATGKPRGRPRKAVAA